jgi:hypothetical protein
MIASGKGSQDAALRQRTASAFLVKERAAKTAVSTNAASTVTEALSEYAQRAKAA